MKLNLKNFFIAFILVQIFSVPVFAYEAAEYPDFSSRSLIMRSITGENRVTQEQKDILTSKKLSPNVACLNEQIKNQNIENVRILLDAKVDPNTHYNTNYPLYEAARVNNMEIVELLVEYGAKPDRGFSSELYEAIKNKNSQMAKYFLDRNANINYVDIVRDITPVYLAVKNNMTDIAQELISKGARVDQKTFILMHKKKMTYLLENAN